MTTTRIIEHQHHEILDDAAREQRRLVLTHHGPEGWRLYKAMFTTGGSTPQEVLVALEPDEDPATALSIRPGQILGGTFRVGHKKCMFNARVEAVTPRANQLQLRLRRPEQLQQLQRRAFERVALPPGSVVAVRFWKESESTPDQRKVRHGQLEDLSAGGMRIRVADPSGSELETTYRCVFTPRPGKPAFVLDALLRHRAALEQDRASLGFQFIGLETTEDGQQTLDRLARFVNQLHRSRQRRRHPKDGTQEH